MKWSPSGSKLGVLTKGGSMFQFDPRVLGAITTGTAHLGPKAQKLAWVDENSILTSGFNKQAEREFSLWDSRNLAEPLSKGNLGDGLGVAHLYFDEQHNLLFVAGRGEGNIGMYNFVKSDPNPLTFLSNFSGPNPLKGFNFLPKHCLDTNKHEVNRGVKLSNNGIVEYVSFRLANRTGQFQDDLYPVFHSNTAASNYGEWAAGTDKPVLTMQLTEELVQVNHNQKKAMFMAKLGSQTKVV